MLDNLIQNNFNAPALISIGYLKPQKVLIDMEAIKGLLKKHPISIIFYLLYGWAVISEYRAVREYEWRVNHGQATHMREWGGVQPFLMGFIFILATMANIIAKKDQMRFYTCLLILIIIPLILLDNMS